MSLAEKCNGSNATERRERQRPAFAKKGVVTFFAIFLLVIFFVGESCINKLMVLSSWSVTSLKGCSCPARDLNSPDSGPSVLDSLDHGPLVLNSLESYRPRPRTLVVRPTVHESYEGLVKGASEFMSTRRAPNDEFKTVIEPNQNIQEFGLTVFRNVCMRPDGPIVMVGMSDDEIYEEISKAPASLEDWKSSYNCSKQWGCTGYETMSASEVPEDVPWVWGTTEHIIPYLSNVFHHFADRVWPHIARFQYPLNQTTPHPIDHFLVYRSNTWLLQANHNMDRNTLMYMIRILATMTPNADFLGLEGAQEVLDKEKKHVDLLCYEKLVLACTTCDRLSLALGSDIITPALLRYRNAAFSYFGIPEPSVPLPPRPLRVAFYGRGDTKRRRVANAQEVVDHLRSYTNPPLDVTFIDELLKNGQYNQSLPEVVSFFSQVDILITVHGANTWAALFMPKHAAVIEIYGPCGPSTWLKQTVLAVELKHDTRSNPWGEAVASIHAGNTTKCKAPFETPDFTLELRKLDEAIHGLSLPTYGSQERLTHHWLHKWQSIQERLPHHWLHKWQSN